MNLKYTRTKKLNMKKTLITLTFAASFLGITASLATASPTKKCSLVKIRTEMQIPECSARGLQNKILLIHSKHCRICKKELPLINQKLAKYRLKKYFMNFSINNSNDLAKLKQKYRLEPAFLPVLIVNCRSYIGEQSPQTYDRIFAAMQKNQK